MESLFIENLANPILQQLPVAVYTTDKKGVITYFNEMAAELWGRRPRLNDPNELAFCGSWKLYRPNGTPLTHDQCPMAMALKYKKSHREEEIIIERPNGSRISALVNINPLFNDQDLLVGAVNVLFEISSLKRIEKNARWLASLVASSNDAIIGKTLTGDITSWNRGAEEMLGYKKQEAIGKNIRMIIPGDRQEEEDMIISKIKRGQKIESFETIRLRKDGSPIPVSLTISPIMDDAGNIVGSSKIARDISQLMDTRQKLKLYTEELNRLNLSKNNFIAMTGHELKTPLAILKANLQFLELQIPEENEWKTFIQNALEQEERLNVIISNLIDISKIEAGKFSLHFKTFNIREFMDECIDNMLLVKNTNPIERQYTIKQPDIHADRIRLGQVIDNLLSNAIKYSVSGSKIMVKVCVDQEHFQISVSDSGPGISDFQKKRVFDIFFRANEMYPGLGVGLYLSKQIIAAHDGAIWVESEPGIGSTFYVKIPLKNNNQ